MRRLLLFAMAMLFFTSTAFADNTNNSTGIETFGAQGQVIPLTNLGKSALGLRVTTVKKKPLPMTVETTGHIEAIPTWQFEQNSLVSGRVLNVLVKQGDRVKAKQPVVLLDSPEINQLAAETLKTKSDLEFQMAEARASMDAEIKQLQTQNELAHLSLKRVEKLFTEGISSQRAFQEAEAEVKLAESRLKAAKEKHDIVLEALKSKLNISYNSLRHRLIQLGVGESRIKDMLQRQHTILTVPVLASRQGQIAQVVATVGETIGTTDALVKISDLSKVWATADIYEDDISRMHTGQTVELKVAAYPNETFSGILTYIGTEVDPSKRTLPVRAEISNSDLRLKPDMYAQMFVQTSQPVETIMLPKEAMVDSTGHSLVFVETSKGFQPTRVKTGRSLGDQIEILSGLDVGQKVVIEGAFQLDAELLKSSGKEEMFAQPTEGERIIGHGESESANDSQSWHVQLVAIAFIIAFLLGVLVTSLTRKSIHEKQSKEIQKQANDGERIHKG